MACDAQTLLAAAAAQGFFRLSGRELKECILYAICNPPNVGFTAQQLIVLATDQGYKKLSDRELDEAILAAACV